jgi:hypothetical protein
MGARFADVTTDDLVALAKDQSRLFVVGMVNPMRPGVRKFAMTLEHTHYSPFNEARNNKFELIFSPWEGMHFMLVVVPMEDKAKCDEVADACGLRLNDGVPTIIDGQGPKPFFLNGKNVWTLESKAGSRIYSEGPQKLIEEEDAELDVLMEELKLNGMRN